MKWKRNIERNAEIVKLFHLLKSTRLVADRMNLRLHTVIYALRQAGVQTPREGRRQYPYAACDRNADLVLKMCAEGCSLAEMGRAVGTKGGEVKKFLQRNGIEKDFPTTKMGEKHYAWRGRLIDKDGYVLIHIKNHPARRKHTPYILEHRLVMEASLGRYLLPTEVVHHKDGNKQNNSIENLELFQSNAEHLAFELKGR